MGGGGASSRETRRNQYVDVGIEKGRQKRKTRAQVQKQQRGGIGEDRRGRKRITTPKG